MKLVRCDGCKTEAPTEALFGNPPEVWATVTRVNKPDLHFCSARCGGEFFRQEVDRRVHGTLELVR